jgi:hypothetical protein
MTDQADKTSADTDDTKRAPPPDEPETVVVDSHTINVDRAELAWSQDDEADEPQRQSWRYTTVVAGVLVACAVVLAGLVLTVCHRLASPAN